MSFSMDDDDDDVVSEINMTPFVDIVLVLLVIFMATATLIAQNNISVNLPPSAVSDAQNEEKEKITITIDANSTIFADDTQTNIISLYSLLANKKAVILRADSKTSFETIIAVIDECKKVKITKYQIETNKK